MFVLGSGAALPTVELTDSALAAIRPTPSDRESRLLERSGVTRRRVSMSIEHILSSKNSDVLQARKLAQSSPTALGVEAVNRALREAGLSIEQVGLIIADTATPYQTCPSEAQRIAGALGVKVPAYDIVAGAQFLPLYASTLKAWRLDRFPDYVVCVSTNVLSQHVCYESEAVAGSLVGDAAVAFVFSKAHKSPWSVVSANARMSGVGRSPFTVDKTLSFDESTILSQEDLRRELSMEFDSIRARVPAALERGWFVGPEMYGRDFVTFVEKQGTSSARVMSHARENGFSMGSSQGAVVSRLLAEVNSGEFVVAVHCENGMTGHVVFMRS